LQSYKAWIKKDLYSTLKNKFPSVLDDALEAIAKGMVVRPEGVSGIKELKGDGIDGFRYEAKLTGRSGSFRLLGNEQSWTNSKGVQEKIIIFEKIFRK
jgi:hypothetical protein